MPASTIPSNIRLTPTQADSDSDPLEATFELNDTLYAKANIPASEDVYLWLGANVMLSYPVGEAEELLEQKLSAAQQSRANCEEDLDFLREQITVSPSSSCMEKLLLTSVLQTMEVATARVYNWDVQQRRLEKGSSKDDGDGNEKTPNG